MQPVRAIRICIKAADTGFIVDRPAAQWTGWGGGAIQTPPPFTFSLAICTTALTWWVQKSGSGCLLFP